MNIRFVRWENFSSFGFLSVGFGLWQKPKVLKCAAGFFVWIFNFSEIFVQLAANVYVVE
tara:strand:+ start:583 stop:759 length:177 start_codon:yes stop_codon:yes gene_type:complete